MDDPGTLEDKNVSIFMERGPGLYVDYSTWVIARDDPHGRVLLGGLGCTGQGQMWVPYSDYLRSKPGYDDAPQMTSDGAFGT